MDARAKILLDGIDRKRLRTLLDRHRVTKGGRFRLSDHDPVDTGGLDISKPDARAMLEGGVDLLSDRQERLYAHGEWSVLCVFQAMDAAGKDSTIKHVMSGVNPQGVQVTSFKAPGPNELAQGFLWRVSRALPPRGHIGILNRSHYEDVLVARVHPELLDRAHLPKAVRGRHFWKRRLDDIAAFEAYLARQGCLILKFFLHLSPEEQRRRLLERLDEPDKAWKFNPTDLAERARWDEYQHAYQAAIAATAAPHAPWFVVPADAKWYTRLVVVAAMVEALDRLDLSPPPVSEADAAARAQARADLLSQA